MKHSTTIDSGSTLAGLAARHAGASRVFHRLGLDYCCHGQVSLQEACSDHGLDVKAVLTELDEALAQAPDLPNPADIPLPALIEHILDRYHRSHRDEVPRLLEMAKKVEAVHGEKPECPRGLARHIERMGLELEAHMQKEEQILFPILLGGRGAMAGPPISVMEAEHQDHGRNLKRLREIAKDFVPPEAACGTWRALYLGLHELERQLMDHIHLENNVLFPRSLRG